MKKTPPLWSTDAIGSTVRQHRRLADLMQISSKGIFALRTAVPGIIMIAASSNAPATQDKQFLDLVETEKKLAEREIEEGFPVLFGLGTVQLWSQMEAGVRDLVASWLENDPATMEAESIQRLKVKIGEYERLKPGERHLYIVEKLEDELGATFKAGLNRYEGILDAIGLGGPVEEWIRRTMFELGHTRNVIVHRAGITDRRFVEACPWVQSASGVPLKVGMKEFQNFFGGCLGYSTTILVRIFQRFGSDPVDLVEIIADLKRQAERFRRVSTDGLVKNAAPLE